MVSAHVIELDQVTIRKHAFESNSCQNRAFERRFVPTYSANMRS